SPDAIAVRAISSATRAGLDELVGDLFGVAERGEGEEDAAAAEAEDDGFQSEYRVYKPAAAGGYEAIEVEDGVCEVSGRGIEVLDEVCAQVAELHAGGEEVVMVTSGAIARGIRVMGLTARPGAIDELQAASAVGQGSLFRAYEERLAAREVRVAQVLLTAFDM